MLLISYHEFYMHMIKNAMMHFNVRRLLISNYKQFIKPEIPPSTFPTSQFKYIELPPTST